MSEKVSIGILAVQGAFAEHQAMLDGLGADTFLIRQKKDLEEAVQNGRLQGIVLPGGESTVQGKLLRDLGMSDQLKELIEADRKSTRLNSSHMPKSRMPSSA